MLPVSAVIDRLVRQQSGKVLAGLIALVRDFSLAEDCLQDAVEAALEHWPKAGMPDNPAAWLTTAARRKALDRLRRAATASQKAADLLALRALEEAERQCAREEPLGDERLRLIFTCCHPALAQETQVALTLKTLGGLTTAEIAKGFLVSEATMAQRIVRAKRKIALAKVPYEVPEPRALPERLEAVLAVLYLIFNEGYFPNAEDKFLREELCEEALRLGRVLCELMPTEPEALGVLALMVLHHARRKTRDQILSEQDRSLWSQVEIGEGASLVERALSLGRPGPYQLQAAIAALHARAPSFEQTDWEQIAALYGELQRRRPSPVVELNRAVAVSMVHGPEVGLRLLEPIATQLRDYQPLHAARADLLRRAGLLQEAARAYRRALAAAPNEVARKYLERQLRALPT